MITVPWGKAQIGEGRAGKMVVGLNTYEKGNSAQVKHSSTFHDLLHHVLQLIYNE